MMMGMDATMTMRRTGAGGIRWKEENKMDIYYDEKIGAWEVKKEPYICLEIAAKEEYELYKKMVAYWWEHHDVEGNEK